MVPVNKTKIPLLTFTVLFGILTCIKPIYPKEMFLQHIGTALFVLILGVDIRRNFLTRSSFIGIILFTILHISAARYIYSYFPYNEWINSVFNIDINAYFGFDRNQFDRFVHFSFGILFFPFAIQIFGKRYGLSGTRAIFVAWLSIQAFSMLYELFEWSLTLIMSSETAENYNGQQGDWWDAQKDMALAMLGSSLMSLFYLIKIKNRKSISKHKKQ